MMSQMRAAIMIRATRIESATDRPRASEVRTGFFGRSFLSSGSKSLRWNTFVSGQSR